MQTNIQKHTKIGLLFAALSVGFFVISPVFAAGTIVSDLKVLQMAESDGATGFSVTLTPEPTDTTTTTYATNGQCVISYNNSAFTTGGAVATKNGTLPMKIKPVDDAEDEGGVHNCKITFSAQSSLDPEYANTVSTSQIIKITDNDTAQLIDYVISKTTTSRLQEGDSFVESYRISPTITPSSPVTITAITDNQCKLVIGSGSNQRTVSSFSQTIRKGSALGISFTILPVDDQEFEGIHYCTIQHTASTTDSNLAGLTVDAYTATLFDNDVNGNIPDAREYEGGLLYFKDANFDGIEDKLQPGVVSFININTNQRQAVALVDKEGRLLNGCSFESSLLSTAYLGGGTTSSITSGNGVIEADMNCGEDDVYLLWIFDAYEETALNWLAYSLNDDAGYVRLPASHMVYNLGTEFTSALLIDIEESDTMRVLQSSPMIEEVPARIDDQYYAADITNAKTRNVTIIASAAAAVAMLWLGYRKFLEE